VATNKTTSRKAQPSPAEWARIELLAMDVDGVLTDGRVTISSDGKFT
jgi:hypothetical protein